MRTQRMRWLLAVGLAGVVGACSHAAPANRVEFTDDAKEGQKNDVAGPKSQAAALPPPTDVPVTTAAPDEPTKTLEELKEANRRRNAPAGTTATEKKVEGEKRRTVIDFSDVQVQGDLASPQAEAYAPARQKAKFPAAPPMPPPRMAREEPAPAPPPPPSPMVEAIESAPSAMPEPEADEDKPSLWSRLFGNKQDEAKPEPPPPPKPAPTKAPTTPPVQKPDTFEVQEVPHAPMFEDHAPNPFVTASEDRLSTFAVDVDTASYTFARRSLIEGQMPNPAGVRVEEFLNYFKYDYPAPEDGRPFSIHLDAAPSPFESKRTLLRVGLQGRKVSISERKPAHLTFLVDVSGSMQSADRLPLAKRSLRILVDNLHDGDTVGLVTYAGSVREVLPPTDLAKKAEIHAAIENLSAGGSTAMGDGLQLAYRQALRMVKPGHVSRVIVLTDGDANVGLTGHAEILKTIAGFVKEGVTLSTIGFGMGNYRDDMLEQLADKGNGNYFYVDGISQARRVFQEQLGGTLEVIAKDVKIQVEFDPKVVSKYRLVGYENRAIADRDFRDDKVDAGEIGAGHSVTAMYELELTGAAGALAMVHVRAKPPEGQAATEWVETMATNNAAKSFEAASPDFRFAAAVMASAEILRRSPVAASWKWPDVEKIAKQAMQRQIPERIEFIELMERARTTVGPLAMR